MDTGHTEARETRDQRKQRELAEKIDEINALRGLDFSEIVGYCYREVMHGGRQSLPPLENIVQDHELGLIYGPGRYMVLYEVYLEDGTKVKKSIKYNIGPEYNRLHHDYCQQNGLPCYLDQVQQQTKGGFALSEFMTEDKVKGLIALLGAVKMVMGGQGSQSETENLRFMLEQQNKTLNTLLTSKPAAGAGITDTLVSEAFKLLSNRQQAPNQLDSMRQQLDFIRDLQGMANPAQEPIEKDESAMEKLISKALEILPAFLQQHNGNIERAAAAAKKQNPMIMAFLKNKDAQRGAYAGLLNQYGKEKADRWAHSFGLDPSTLGAIDVHVNKPAAQPTKPAAAGPANSGVIFL